MQSIKFLDQLKSQISLKEGLNKIHYAILILIIVLIFLLLFSNEKQKAPTFKKSDMITPVVLKAIYEQNINRKLEYAESKPILRSMKKHLYDFERMLQTRPEQAMGALLIVKRRLLYLKNKGLDVSKAEKILVDYMNKIKQKDNEPD